MLTYAELESKFPYDRLGCLLEEELDIDSFDSLKDFAKVINDNIGEDGWAGLEVWGDYRGEDTERVYYEYFDPRYGHCESEGGLYYTTVSFEIDGVSIIHDCVGGGVCISLTAKQMKELGIYDQFCEEFTERFEKSEYYLDKVND